MFLDMIKEQIISEQTIQDIESEESDKLDESKDPQKILRDNGIKVKLVTPTAFGTQIDLYRMPEEDIEELLKDFNVKIKNKSIFIVD